MLLLYPCSTLSTTRSCPSDSTIRTSPSCPTSFRGDSPRCIASLSALWTSITFACVSAKGAGDSHPHRTSKRLPTLGGRASKRACLLLPR